MCASKANSYQTYDWRNARTMIVEIVADVQVDLKT
jgi:hypothetical protein